MLLMIQMRLLINLINSTIEVLDILCLYSMKKEFTNSSHHLINLIEANCV